MQTASIQFVGNSDLTLRLWSRFYTVNLIPIQKTYKGSIIMIKKKNK